MRGTISNYFALAYTTQVGAGWMYLLHESKVLEAIPLHYYYYYY